MSGTITSGGGFAIKPIKGDWSLYKKHIMEGIASGDNKLAAWIMAWMARIVQEPGGGRPGTAIVLKGKRGTGKNVFTDIFGKLFGCHYKLLDKSGQLTGRFNNHFKDALLVMANEAFWAGDKDAEGTLKSLITEPTINIEAKGKDQYPVKNHVNLIMASNNDWVVPAGLEERRFCVVEVSDKHMQDKKHFGPIIDQMRKYGGLEAMLYDLLYKAKISKFDLRKIPQTKALLDQKIHSMTPVQRYWINRLQEGSLLSGRGARQYGDPAKLGWDIVPRDVQHQDFLKFCKELNVRPIDDSQFGIALKVLCKGIGTTQKNNNGKRQRFRTFPGLNNCRKQFETLMQLDDYDWDA